MSLPRPDFLIIGAQKCGTSWLHARLREHPDCFLPDDKDYEFLSYAGHLADPDWRAGFARRFAGAPAGVLTGDACASYLWTTEPRPPGFNPDLPASARELCGPGLRVIVLVRDPVVRAISAYLHHIAHASLDWNRALPEAPAELGIVELGRYGAQVAAWVDGLGAARVRVLPAPGAADPAEVLGLACAFLDRSAPQAVDVGTVFPGLERREDADGGVWIRADDERVRRQPTLTRKVTQYDDEAGRWVRIIEPGHRAWVGERLAPDTRAFAQWLDRHGQRHPAMDAWLPETG